MEMLCFFHVSGWLVCWCLEARTDLCLNLSSIYSLNLFKTRSSQFPIETRIIWVLGIYIYISINNMIYAFTHLWVIQILLLKHFSDGSYHFFGISPPKYILFVVSFLSLFVCQQKISPIHLVPFFFWRLSQVWQELSRWHSAQLFCKGSMGNLLPWRYALCDDLWISYQLHRRFLVFFVKFVGADFPRIFLNVCTIFVGKPRIRMEFPHLMELLFQWFPPKVIPPTF